MPQQELQVQQKREVEKKQESTVPARTYLPVTDIFEPEQASVMMEMPGVDKQNVEVTVENDVLSVTGRIDFVKYEALQPVYMEYNVGHYARSFQLSSKIDQGKISADLKDGVKILSTSCRTLYRVFARQAASVGGLDHQMMNHQSVAQTYLRSADN